MSELKKILYVEDDEDIAEVATMTLEEIGGFEVKHCISGVQALGNLPKFNPQLILMDVMMPEMDGPQTLKHMQQKGIADKIPVVFMTAKAQTHQQEEYKQMGAVGVIVKPFDPMTLCQQITRLWEEASGR